MNSGCSNHMTEKTKNFLSLSRHSKVEVSLLEMARNGKFLE